MLLGFAVAAVATIAIAASSASAVAAPVTVKDTVTGAANNWVHDFTVTNNI